MVRVLVMAGIWAATSLSQVPVWRDNVTLWTHARVMNPALARPALNLAVALRKRGENEQALLWLSAAQRLSSASPRTREVQAAIRYELAWMSMFGFPACSHPSAPPVC